MSTHQTLQRSLLKVFLYSALALFLIPALTHGFVRYAQNDMDRTFLQAVKARVFDDATRTSDEKQEVIDYYRQRPLSTLCGSKDPDAQEFRQDMCADYTGEVWQFHMARRVAVWTMLGGVVVLLAVGGLSALAFLDRKLRYASFVVGWRLMMAASTAEVVLQGAMAVWLSFWVTAFFAQKYYVKLILIVGLLVLAGVALLIKKIFEPTYINNVVEGELVPQTDAPKLWRRIRQMAARLKIAPPDHLVAGIDTNFFVTESPLVVGGQQITGRILFVSIPLLRVLSEAEADAVLGHELAHFRGGDTRNSAMLGPKLQQYDQYVRGMLEAGFTIVVYHFMLLYRMIFQVALSKESREREFKADRAASRLVSPQAIVHSLIKIAAYDNYRNNTERTLFDSDQQLDETLGIAASVAQGLRPYATSDDFFDDMRTAHVPHPFDSHPPMAERMKNVGFSVPTDDFGLVVNQEPRSTWVDEMPTADDIEKRLWAVYEQQFAQNHERALAYRYEPSTEEQMRIVLKYFPPVVFKLKKDAFIEVNFEGLAPSDEPLMPWEAVKALQYNESSFGDSLTVTLHEKGVIGSKTAKIKLAGLGKQKEQFNAVVAHYWRRHQIMRSQ